ncbi:hypothetical protein EIP86_002500 [Pleurotus ostreatoroseus]|nr:hypothetical protein EIP86_002500 [Pleurotus ostreatoroseus]
MSSRYGPASRVLAVQAAARLMAPKRITLSALSIALAAYAAVAHASALYTSSSVGPNDTSLDASPDLAARPRALVDLVFRDFALTDVLTPNEFESLSTLYGANGTEPAGLAQREVYSPPITSPDSSTVWVAGSQATVTWDTSSLPHQGGPFVGTIVLGYLRDGSENEHLDAEHPLAQGFDLSQGAVDVKVPLVQPGNDYIIVREYRAPCTHPPLRRAKVQWAYPSSFLPVFGDSGNRSPTFTIN